MSLENISDSDISDAREQINNFLSRSLDVKDITAVESDEVFARTNAGRDIGEYDVCFRVEVGQPDSDEVLDTWSDVTSHLRDQLESMERNSNAPDTLLLSEDHPPEHLENKPLVYYLQSTM